jgi:cytochrome c oxidase subunit 2
MLGCIVILATGCSNPQSYLTGSSPGARSIAQFGWFALGVFCIAAAAVWILLIWIASRRRGTFGEHASVDLDDGRNWVVVGGLAIPTIVFLFLFGMMFRPMHAFPMHDRHERAPDIRVTGRQWWFNAEYLFARPDLDVAAPTEIHIPVGRPIEVELVTHDVIHSFWVPRLRGKVDLIPGEANRLQLLADSAGVFEGECAEFCGVQHAHMRVQIVAQSPDDYARWLDQQRQPASNSADPEAIRGSSVFQRSACPLCHTVRGTDAHGQVGPDLTHVGSRARIAGGMLANNTANLAAWIVDAQSLKPGAGMPTLRQLNGADLRALVAYLQSLR